MTVDAERGVLETNPGWNVLTFHYTPVLVTL